MNPNSKMTGGSTDGIVNMIQGGLELNDVFDEIYECKPETTIKYVKPADKIIYKYITQPSTIVYGGDEINTIEDYIKVLIDIQKKFNKGYETFYRGLTNELNTIKLPKEYINKTDLYSLVKQLEQIAIRNPKTTCYISGIYSARNYNGIYRDMIKTIINNIERSDFKILNGVLEQLKTVLKLLEDTYKNINDVQIKMLSSPRGSNDYLIMNTKKILKPSSLNLNDFNNLSIAIRRILTSINSMRVESDIYNFKNSLDKFIQNVNDRNKMIKEYYSMEKQRFIYENQETFFSYGSASSNVQRIYNVLIDRKQESMIYMNSVLDMELAKLKLNTESKAILNESDMKRIEEIYLNFKYAQSSDKIEKTIKKIKTSTNYNSFEYILIIIKKLKSLFRSSGQVKMIIDIYNTLKIFPNDFDWKKFEDEYINLVTLNTIKIGHLFKVTGLNLNDDKTNSTLMTYSQIVEILANACEQCTTDRLVLTLKPEQTTGRDTVRKILYQALHGICDRNDMELKFINYIKNKTTTIVNAFNGIGYVNKDSSISVDKLYDGKYYLPYVQDDYIKEKYVESLNNMHGIMKFSEVDTINKLIGSDKDEFYNLIYNIARSLHDELIGHYVENNEIKYTTPFYIKYWPLPVIQFMYAIKNNKQIKDFLKSQITSTNRYGVELSIERNLECDIASYAIATPNFMFSPSFSYIFIQLIKI